MSRKILIVLVALAVAVIAYRIYSVATATTVVVPTWVTDRTAPPRVEDPAVVSAPVREDAAVVVDMVPPKALGNAMTDAKAAVRFEASTLMTDQISLRVAEEMTAQVQRYWGRYMTGAGAHLDDNLTRDGNFLFSVWPDIGDRIRSGEVTVSVEYRVRVERTPGGLMWLLDAGKKTASCVIQTPSYVVTLGFTRPAKGSDIYDGMFPDIVFPPSVSPSTPGGLKKK